MTQEKIALCGLDWSNYSSLDRTYYLGHREDFYNDWRKVKPVLRWGTMHNDLESLKVSHPMFLAYHDAETGLAGVNPRRMPILRLLSLPEWSL